MTDPQGLKDRLARRPLTPAEQSELAAWLAAHPEPDAQAEWEAEQRLTRALRALPDAPLPSNFTARVLQSVDLEDARQTRVRRTPGRSLGPFLTRVGWLRPALVAALLLGTVAYLQHHRRMAARTQLAHALAELASHGPLPSAEVWRDFDAVYRLSTAPVPVDVRLLAELR